MSAIGRDIASALEQTARQLDVAATRASRTRFTSMTGFRTNQSLASADTAISQLTTAAQEIGEGPGSADIKRAVGMLEHFREVASAGPDRNALRAAAASDLRPAADAVEGAVVAITGKEMRSSVERALRSRSAGPIGVRAEDVVAQPGKAASKPVDPKTAKANYEHMMKVLAPYGTDLTAAARRGELDPVIGRTQEIDDAIEILSRRRNNNVALIGPAGVGKTALAEGIAQRIADGTAPGLEGATFFSLNTQSVTAGTRFRGEFEEKLQSIIAACNTDRNNVILFADEMHTLMGAGSHSNESSVGGNMLKPALSRGKLKMMGATTLDEYRSGVESDPAFARRFERVMLDPPNDRESREIARSIAASLSEEYDVRFSRKLANMAADTAGTYVKTTHRPDSIMKIMLPAARVARREATEAGINVAEHPPKVTIAHLREGLKQVTGIDVPIGEIDDSRAAKLLHAEDHLGEMVFGQPEAVAATAGALRRAEAGLKPDNRPIGSLAFLGPTGVGKTELARGVSKLLFDDPDLMIRIDGSEFQHAGSELTLIGGRDGAGKLTEYVRQHPYSVVLFDEVEKANPAMHKLLLQILDAGRLTDQSGRQVDFSNSVIIMTSNAGAKQIIKAPDAAARADVARNALQDVFAPELYNRIDDIVPFRQLEQEQIRMVVGKLAQQEVADSLKKRRNIDVKFSDSALDLLSASAFHPDLGARPARRAIQRFVSDPLANVVLDRTVSSGKTVNVASDGNDLVFLVDDVEVARSTPVAVEPERADPAGNQDISKMLENILGNQRQ